MLANIEDISTNFNKEQIEAIKSINGYVFNSAPPGSGKTFVLENRILWMAIEHQIPTKNILAITFTNEAANEMKNRITERLHSFNIENNVTATTFHSFAFHVIRNFGTYENKFFTLIDDADKHKIISQMLKDKKLDEGNKELNAKLTKEYSNMISGFKSNGYTLKELFESLKANKEELDLYANDKDLAESKGYTKLDIQELIEIQNYKVKEYEIYQLYEESKKAYAIDRKNARLYDFDDLMLHLKMILSRKDIRKKISKLYTYILCDESQDIDKVQRDILLLLSKDNGNLFCIFDDDQSIYSFRHADPELILSLPEKVTNSKSIVLKENFRSTRNIIEAANYIINNNSFRIPKWMTTNNPDGELVTYKGLPSKEAEAEFVCNTINKLMEEYKFDYSDFAVLYRNNALNKTIEQRLLKYSIPYKINRNISFFQRKEIKDILAYLEVIINKSPFYLDRIYKVPARGLGDKTYLDLKTKAINCGMNIFEIMEADTKTSVKDFYNLITELQEMLEKSNFNQLIDCILEKTKYIELEFNEKEREQRLDNINYLKNMFHELESLFNDKQEILVQIKILSGDDEERRANNKVSLMTIHSSKGKGFKVVFIIGCEDGIIPSFGAISDVDYEEERRLFYVAMTRAKLFCFMTRSQYRIDFEGNFKPTKLSPFIKEIPENLINFDEDLIF